MRRTLCLISLLAASFLPTAAAKADILATFALSGDFTPNPGVQGNPSGTVTIDTTTGAFASIDIGYTAVPSAFTLRETYFFQVPNQPIEFGVQYFVPAYGSEISEDIVLPTDSLVGYAGGPICSLANPCPFDSSFLAYVAIGPLVDGQLTQIGQSPEPSSFALLGTGLLGAVAAVRRNRSLVKIPHQAIHQ